MIHVAQRIIKQLRHDHRSMAMLIIVPILLISLLYLLLSDSDYTPKVALDDLSAPMVSELEKQDNIKIVDMEKNIIEDEKADAVISQDEDGVHILMFESDSVKTKAVTDALKDASAELNPQAQTTIDFLHGDSDQSLFDSLGFLLLGILSFFLIFIFSGISFVRERTSSTVERLMLTPIKTPAVVGGYMLGFGAFAVIQSTLLLLYVKFVLKMEFVGDWWLALVIMLLLAMVAVVMGTFVSTISKSEFQVVQFIPAVIVPQIFFSGLIPVDTLPYHLDYLSKIMPLYYGSMGLKDVVFYGYGMGEVYPWILALCIFIVIFFVANVLAVKKYRA